MDKLRARLSNVRDTLIFELVFVALAIVSVSLLVYEVVVDMPEEQLIRAIRIDFWIAIIFLVDFFVGMILSDNYKRYFKYNWYMLLASIPVNEYVFRGLRVLRLLRIMRIVSSLSRTLYISRYTPQWFKRLKAKITKQ